jgi:hypothetical protein
LLDFVFFFFSHLFYFLPFAFRIFPCGFHVLFWPHYSTKNSLLKQTMTQFLSSLLASQNSPFLSFLQLWYCWLLNPPWSSSLWLSFCFFHLSSHPSIHFVMLRHFSGPWPKWASPNIS